MDNMTKNYEHSRQELRDTDAKNRCETVRLLLLMHAVKNIKAAHQLLLTGYLMVPNPGGGWDVKRGGAQRASKHQDRKQDAVDSGRQISRNQNTEFFIHGKDGQIQSKDSHGNDPFPPKG